MPQKLVRPKTDDEVRKRIEDLDLEPIMVKIMDPDEGEGWTLEQTQEAVRWYRRFLFLNFKYSDQAVVPSQMIDVIWHAHILDTKKYAEDCQQIFGEFIHHFPYFGMRGDDDATNLQSSFDGTNALYMSEFGESPVIAAIPASGNCHSCGPNSCGVTSCGSNSCGGDARAPIMRTTERPRL